MSFTDFITNHGKKVSKNAFIRLVQISRVDGKISREEIDLLYKEGKKFGLTEPEIEKLINEGKDSYYNAPYTIEEKFEHLYNMAEMILADEIVKDKEMKMIRKFAVEVGLDDKKIDDLIAIIIEGIKKNTDEEELLKKFRKKILH